MGRSITRRDLLAQGGLIALAAPALAQPAKRVTIAISSASLPGGVARIAREMGLFERRGVDVRVSIMDNSTIASSALISGSVEFTTSAGTEVVVAQARGQREIAVTRLYEGFSGVLVLSKTVADKLGVSPTAPVAERWRAMDGLVILSTSPTSSYTIATRLAAEQAGAKLRFTYGAMASSVTALESGAVQGYVASSPFYAFSVLKGSGVLWVNGPKGEYPTQFLPGSVNTLNTMRPYAEANPDVVRRINLAFADLVQAVKQQPAEVKAAVAKLFPDTDTRTLDLLFDTEAPSLQARPASVEDLRREIAFVKLGGVPVPGLERLDPATMILGPN